MLRTRVIPCLLLREAGLVKTTRFERPSYVGDPINVVRIFNEKEVDELILLDIVASKERTPPDFDLLEQIASEAFMPVCYGGGVRSVEDARRLLKLGIEKIAVNTAALEDPMLVKRLSDTFGAQCVVASIDVKRPLLGTHRVFSHAGRRVPERDPVAWAKRLVKLGAGEVLLNSVDRDGTMAGYDLELLRAFDGQLAVPVVACGGAGSVQDMAAALRTCRLSGLGAGARFVYYGPHKAVLVTYLDAAELRTLQA